MTTYLQNAASPPRSVAQLTSQVCRPSRLPSAGFLEHTQSAPSCVGAKGKSGASALAPAVAASSASVESTREGGTAAAADSTGGDELCSGIGCAAGGGCAAVPAIVLSLISTGRVPSPPPVLPLADPPKPTPMAIAIGGELPSGETEGSMRGTGGEPTGEEDAKASMAAAGGEVPMGVIAAWPCARCLACCC